MYERSLVVDHNLNCVVAYRMVRALMKEKRPLAVSDFLFQQWGAGY
jgi:hypothetical protein